MGYKVGVVCEGSHDFSVLHRLVASICNEHRIELEKFECLQPQISATFAQVSGGGWGRVKGWCETSNGTFYRTFIDQPLFAQSNIYDFLIIHLDGDVLDHCESPPLDKFSTDGLPPTAIVSKLEEAILGSWLSLRPEDGKKVLPCIPVRHLEAWLLGAFNENDKTLETTDTKDRFKSELSSKYAGKIRNLYTGAARDAGGNLQGIRNTCESFVLFEGRLKAAAS